MSITHKFGIGGHEGYITVGLYPNGAPGEIFIRMAKEGSTISGLMDSFATAISMALQHGVPLKVLVEKFAHTRFEPSGWTGSEELGYAKSIMDYLFRWMQLRFLSGQQLDLFANLKQPTLPAATSSPNPATPALLVCHSAAQRRNLLHRLPVKPHEAAPRHPRAPRRSLPLLRPQPTPAGHRSRPHRPRRHGSVILRRRRRTCF